MGSWVWDCEGADSWAGGFEIVLCPWGFSPFSVTDLRLEAWVARTRRPRT